MLRVKGDVYQETEAGDQSMADHSVVTAVAGGGVEESYGVDLCYADSVFLQERMNVSDFLFLESGTFANSRMVESGVEAEAGGLYCSSGQTLIYWREWGSIPHTEHALTPVRGH